MTSHRRILEQSGSTTLTDVDSCFALIGK
ncbi:hypothetical protein DFAR_1800001 [Desulfarculales bacterium]